MACPTSPHHLVEQICFMELSKQHSSNSHLLFKNTRREADVQLYLQHFFRQCGGPPQLGGVKSLCCQKSATVTELAEDRLLKPQKLLRGDQLL